MVLETVRWGLNLKKSGQRHSKLSYSMGIIRLESTEMRWFS
jgi:hypothetical protein